MFACVLEKFEPIRRAKRPVDRSYGDSLMMIAVVWRAALFVLLTFGTTALMALAYLG